MIKWHDQDVLNITFHNRKLCLALEYNLQNGSLFTQEHLEIDYPTLLRYPDDCIISIDDDWLYPEGMIADFMNVHRRYPNFPISGNREVYHGMQCHCGCASLTKAIFFEGFLDFIDESVISNCSSDDLVCTYFANKAGYSYIRTDELYFYNMVPYNAVFGYSENIVNNEGVEKSYSYLVKRFGDIVYIEQLYIKDSYIAFLLNDIHNKVVTSREKDMQIRTQTRTSKEIYATTPYRLGLALLKPLLWIRKIAK